jgi:hypothetical protein
MASLPGDSENFLRNANASVKSWRVVRLSSTVRKNAFDSGNSENKSMEVWNSIRKVQVIYDLVGAKNMKQE